MSHWTEEIFVENAELYVPELLAIDQQGDGTVEEILELLDGRDKSPESVLDVGCGIGRHARAFAARGIETTGIDISPAFLDRARERVEGEAADNVEFRELDMRSVDEVDETFDLAVCLHNTIGYFDDEQNVEVLRKMRERLSDDGVCVIQVENKDRVLAHFPDSRVQEHEGQMVVEQYAFSSRRSRLKRTRDAFHGDPDERQHVGRTEYDVRLYSPPELEAALRNAGFESVGIYEGYDGSPVGVESDQLVAVAE